MPQEQVEEYLESIYDLAGRRGTARTTECAARLGLSPASVTEVFRRLARDGLVAYEPYRGVSLTADGLAVARQLKRKHRLVEVFLERVLGIPPAQVHAESCRLEHAVSETVADALCRHLGAPTSCPDGQPIPPCNRNVGSCVECANSAGSPDAARPDAVMPITDLEIGQSGRVGFIRGEERVTQRLADLGLTPGAELTLVRVHPGSGPVELRVRQTSVAVDRAIADRIFLIDDGMERR